MKIFIKSIFVILFCVWYSIANAQAKEIIVIADSINSKDTTLMELNTASRVIIPRKATIYSAVVPGLGQIYNKQWWKVPFVYGGFVGFGIVINFNHQNYLEYFRAYSEFTDKNPNTTFYNDVLKYEIDEFSEVSDAKATLKKGIEYYSRQRNLYVIITAGFYLFNILDANVSAHLIDFDISEDLSFYFEPIATDPFTNTPIMGATFTYNF